jgi:thiol-disulfide isomerase/thioredoxin
MEVDELKKNIKHNNAVMLYFSGEFCNVCKILQHKIKNEFKDKLPKIKQIYINGDKFKQTAIEYGVFSFPTIIVFFDNKEFARKNRNLSVQGFIKELYRPYNLFFEIS